MARIDFMGNLGGEAKVGFTPNGNAKLEFNVADTKGKKDAQGNWDKESEQTQWFRCTLWGPDAEYYAERLRKGSRVSVYGELMAREYVDKDGASRTSLDVTVRGLSVVNKPGTTPAPAQRQQPGSWAPQQPATQQQPWGGNQPAQNSQGWGQGGADNNPPF